MIILESNLIKNRLNDNNIIYKPLTDEQVDVVVNGTIVDIMRKIGLEYLDSIISLRKQHLL